MFPLKAAAMGLFCCTLSACAQQPTPPLDSQQVRIEQRTSMPLDQLRAYRLNGELVRNLRFPDLPPGSHELQVRFQFEVPGGGQRNGGRLESRERTCILGLSHDDFRAGQQYQIYAERRGWQPAAWLLNPEGERLTRARIIRCGPGL